jgi:hypothetical protein
MKDDVGNPEAMVAAGNAHIPTIKSKAQAGSDVASTVAQWEAANTELATANQKVVDADAAAAAARTARAVAMHAWRGRARGCLNAVTVEAAGSEQAIKTYVLDVEERLESPLETTPTGVTAVKSTITGVAGWTWETHKGNHGYSFQYATDPNNAATYTTPQHCTKGKLTLTGQTPAVVLHGRVAALDSRLPGGQTAWSGWVAVPVSQ